MLSIFSKKAQTKGQRFVENSPVYAKARADKFKAVVDVFAADIDTLVDKDHKADHKCLRFVYKVIDVLNNAALYSKKPWDACGASYL